MARTRTSRSPERAFRHLERLRFRGIGPFRGGRVVAVAGDPSDRLVFYFGSTGGGVWKTTDGGQYWRNVSDGHFRRSSVGALAVAPSDPNVVYAGMGEACIRGNVASGDGVWRSTDAGRTWLHLGLPDTRHIGRVRVHPAHPDVVYVAALGHAHAPNAERGLFRSTDGGARWQRALHRGSRAGAIDVALDGQDPRILYCSTWEALRTPWSLISGGPGSGLFRSTDDGDTWTDISRARGLPAGTLGRIGIATTAARAGRLYAIVEADDGAVFRSDDHGDTWERLCDDPRLRTRPFYYHHIVADPLDAETVWVLNTDLWRSADGGRTFVPQHAPHPDNHDLWIDPRDPRRMIEGNDGGATVTFDGGETWSPQRTQPTAEMYHVTTDSRTPYRIYGAQQDATTLSMPSRSSVGAITANECYAVGGGESGFIAVRPDDPDVVYAGFIMGFLTRYDHRTGQARNIDVWPEAAWGWGARDLRHRFRWSFPIALSPHDPNVLYVCGERVFRSTDEGAIWNAISPDLTRNDRGRQAPSGTPLTADNCGTEWYCTIATFAESPVARGTLWAGSDDGLIHLSRDDGRTWRNVTPRTIPAWTLISAIEPSPHDAAVAYVAATRYLLDDQRPMLFRTADHGRTWSAIASGIPADEPTRVVREDPIRRGLLYAGTETGCYVSADDGRRWHRSSGQLPVVPVHDIAVKDDDLILATHGRGFWILDDVGPLREDIAAADRDAPWLFTPRTHVRFRASRHPGTGVPSAPGNNYRGHGATVVTWRPAPGADAATPELLLDAGPNPPDGVIVRYLLPDGSTGKVTLSFHDAAGRVVRRFTSDPTADGRAPRIPAAPGLNTFVWDTRCEGATAIVADALSGAMPASSNPLAGPLAPPGRYEVRLRAGRVTRRARFEIRADPRTGATASDLAGQFSLLLRLRDKLSETHEAVNEIRRIRRRLDVDGSATRRRTARIRRELEEVEGELVQTRTTRSIQETVIHPVKLNAKLGGLISRVGAADARPTRASYAFADEIVARIDAQLTRLARLRAAIRPEA
ncbi:MAG: glycosyl hydrolase [Chloroflexi bacterium]|nr:glycosyl hydrolase [Chloroflexota bacterium]